MFWKSSSYYSYYTWKYGAFVSAVQLWTNTFAIHHQKSSFLYNRDLLTACTNSLTDERRSKVLSECRLNGIVFFCSKIYLPQVDNEQVQSPGFFIN